MNTAQLEKTVLSAFFINPDLLKEIDLLKEEYFSVNEYRKTFANLKEFSKKGLVLDLVTYSSQFRDEDIKYLTDIASTFVKTTNFYDYCKQLKEFAQRRKLLCLTMDIKDKIDSPDIFDFAEKEILNIRDNASTKSMYTSKEVIDIVVQKTFDRSQNPNKLLGLDTGFKKLNDTINGFQPGFHIIAARPGMGKTSFGVDIALNFALKENKKVAFFTLELSKEQIYQKMISQEGMIESERVFSGKLAENEWRKFNNAASVIYNSNMVVSDDINKIEDIVSMARRLKKQDGIDAIFIDYLQLIDCKDGSNENERTGNISKALMSLWKELNVPIIAIAQLSRGPELRTDKRPRMADLRNSGQIEQDALTIIMLYRDEYYNPETTKYPGLAEVLIEKNRFGPTGMFKLGFVGPMTKFVNLDKVAKR